MSLQYQWTPANLGERADKVLSVEWNISRTQIQRWIESGLVTKNGQIFASKQKVAAGDLFEVSPPPPEPSEILPCEKDLEVLFEDEHIIVLNKAPGDIVHPGAGEREGTLVSALLHHCKGQLSGIGGVERPGIVHRLDRETSGVLVVAKTDESHRHLSEQFQSRALSKVYRAYVLGCPRHPSGSWMWAIGRHPIHRHKMTVAKQGGRESHTDFRVLEKGALASFLELDLHTGRTHQIRVHAAHAGHPVVGDATYGRQVSWVKEAGVTRQLLHAWKITLTHPAANKTVEFIAPLPEDFKSFKTYLAKHEHGSSDRDR